MQALLDQAKSPRTQLEVLEQAAKDAGGLYTNRRELTGKDGGPIQTQGVPADLTALTDAELDELERLLDKTADPRGGAGRAGAP